MQFNQTQPSPLTVLLQLNFCYHVQTTVVSPDTHPSSYSSVATTLYPTLVIYLCSEEVRQILCSAIFVFGGSETDTVQRDICHVGLAGCRFVMQITGTVCSVNKSTAQSHLNFSYFYPSVPVCLSNVFLVCETTNVIAKSDCPHIATHQRTLGECGFPTPVLSSRLPSSFCLLQKVFAENLVSPYIHFSLHIVCSIQWLLMLRQGRVDSEERY
jgi:hypothetical protein